MTKKTIECQINCFSMSHFYKMAVRANTYRVNVICILILIMIRFSYTKRLTEVKADELNTEEVYGLCLIG